jgi:hypothetical protein
MFESLKKAKAQHETPNFLENFVTFPKEGAIIIRILPSTQGQDFFSATRTHKINGKNIHCPKTHDETTNKWVGKCPVCDYIAPLWRQSEKASSDEERERLQTEYRNLKCHPRFYANCIIRSETDLKTGETRTNVGPKIISMSKQLFDLICDAILADPLNPDDVTDLKTGKDFVITVNRKGEWPDFTKSKFAPKSTPAGTKDEVTTWMNNLHDIHGLRKVMTTEELEKEIRIMLGEEKETETPIRLADPNPPIPPVNHGAMQVGSSSITSNGTEGLADDDFLAELNKAGFNN